MVWYFPVWFHLILTVLWGWHEYTQFTNLESEALDGNVAQGHPASKWWTWDLNSKFWVSKDSVLDHAIQREMANRFAFHNSYPRLKQYIREKFNVGETVVGWGW